MASQKKNTKGIDPIQRELIEKAQSRARQKRRLYVHFILFLIGSAVFILLNVVFNVGQNYRPLEVDWFVWAIILWAIIFLSHAFNVFITNKFLGKDWENNQIERLVAQQQKRIDKLRAQVEKDLPLPSKKELRHSTPNPNSPIEDPANPESPFKPIKSTQDPKDNPNKNLNP